MEVLNAGGAPDVAGFRAAGSGPAAIADGSQPLSATASGPEDVAISPDGRQVVVTEKPSYTIETFAVGWGGTLAAAVTSPSDSPLSFAEVFTPSGQLLVDDDGSAGTSAVSPYRIAPDGTVHATQAAVPDGQTAACWISEPGTAMCSPTTRAAARSLSGWTARTSRIRRSSARSQRPQGSRPGPSATGTAISPRAEPRAGSALPVHPAGTVVKTMVAACGWPGWD